MIQVPLKTPKYIQISKINKIPHSPKLKELRNYTKDNNQYDKRVITYKLHNAWVIVRICAFSKFLKYFEDLESFLLCNF